MSSAPVRVVVARRGKDPVWLEYRTNTAAKAALKKVWSAIKSGTNLVVHQSEGKPVKITGSECTSACISG